MDVVGLILSGRAPGALKKKVSRGLVPLGQFDLLRCLAHLAFDGESDIEAPARRMLGAMPRPDIVDACSLHDMPAEMLDVIARLFSRDEAVLEEILFHPAVKRRTVSFIATLPLPGPLEIIGLHHPWIDPFPPIIEKLRADSSIPPEVILAWEERHELLLEFRALGESGGAGRDESFHPALIDENTDVPSPAEKAPPPRKGREKHSVAELLRDLPAGQKIALALKGNSEARRSLVTDKNRSVCTKVLENPGITEGEVVFYSRLTSLSRDVLRIIGANREWMKNRAVVRSLVANPKTPLGLSMKHLPRLPLRDIKGLTTNRNIPAALRHTAEDVLRARIESR